MTLLPALFPRSFHATNPIQSNPIRGLTISRRSSQYLHGRVNIRYAPYFKYLICLLVLTRNRSQLCLRDLHSCHIVTFRSTSCPDQQTVSLQCMGKEPPSVPAPTVTTAKRVAPPLPFFNKQLSFWFLINSFRHRISVILTHIVTWS